MDGTGLVLMFKHSISRVSDSEKITLNVGYVDLGRMDLLVRDGFYSSRTDLMRTAVRALLDRHDDALKRSADRCALDIGIRRFGRAELEAARDAGSPLHIRVLGLAVIASDVDVQLALAAVASVEVLGTLQADPAIRSALKDRVV